MVSIYIDFIAIVSYHNTYWLFVFAVFKLPFTSIWFYDIIPMMMMMMVQAMGFRNWFSDCDQFKLSIFCFQSKICLAKLWFRLDDEVDKNFECIYYRWMFNQKTFKPNLVCSDENLVDAQKKFRPTKRQSRSQSESVREREEFWLMCIILWFPSIVLGIHLHIISATEKKNNPSISK